MVLNVLFRPLSFTFAIVTLVESLIWSILSFLGILCYLDILKYDTSNLYGVRKFAKNLYDLYLSEKPLWIEDRFITPNTFYTLMWIYFILSLFLLVASGVHITVLSLGSKPRKINFSTLVWLILVYLTCLFDIITCIFFGVDFHYAKKKINHNDTAETELIITVIFVLLTLAAKGFVLWIYNVVTAVILSVLFKKKLSLNDESIIRADKETEPENYLTYNAYGNTNFIGDEQTDDTLHEVVNNERTEENDLYDNISFRDPQDQPWHLKLSREESRQNYSSLILDPEYADPLDGILSTSSTFPRIPRASSFRQPRSLRASVCPSPVSLPREESARKSVPAEFSPHMETFQPFSSKDRNYSANTVSSGYRTENDNDDDEDVIESIDKMKRVYPNKERFNLDEPDPDYK